ncbi:hypothetical protein GO755_19265 [Spirosoma sp. HMF4905]|uniref:HTH arsR-type domain-containing protein n=1 Tax=Spirosoma arboris TaxID=2682092 RepID=A0A7K1SF25_9BACT|nr:hypothetical protein [Spirosoma arboris]MVM32196.1 hypothetical protein [Spirosoma arboris]
MEFFDQGEISRLASLMKAVGHPLRVQIVGILAQERLVSIPTLQNHLPSIDQFVLYSNLSFLHEKKILKKHRKGREIYYSLTDNMINDGIALFSLSKLVKPTIHS